MGGVRLEEKLTQAGGGGGGTGGGGGELFQGFWRGKAGV